MVGSFQCARPQGAFSLLRGGVGCLAADLHRPVGGDDRDRDVLRDVSRDAKSVMSDGLLIQSSDWCCLWYRPQALYLYLFWER